jgi:phage gp29-like protein
LRCQSNVAQCQDNIVYRTYLLVIMTRQEMQKLLDELDRKHVKAQDEQVIEEPDDELAQELEKPKKELLH